MTSGVDLLVPRPRRAEETGERLELRGLPEIRIEGSEEQTRAARGRVERGLAEVRLADVEQDAGHSHLTLELRDDGGLDDEGYRLTVGAAGMRIVARSPRGLFYGAVTIAQWLRLHDPGPDAVIAELPGLVVEDAPGFTARGVMLDISRNRVPRLETLRDLVDMLSDLKVNQLQLYTEHAFAYAGHERVWEGSSPLTADDIQSLDAYCRRRFVELVPNQQSFGHMHRWLIHEPYRRLAECPEGVEHPFSLEREPFSLCPIDPRSLELLDDLYRQLLPNFSSRILNVGLDETLDLGLGRSESACADRGKHVVYLDFLAEVRDLAARHGRRIQFWSDIILEHPDIIDRVPEDAIALTWGYEADHPFEDETQRLSASGRKFYVCPGTSSWNSFGGRAQNALQNLASAARWGSAHGADGYLITDWGDNGHLQPLAASFLGFLAGATFAWNPAAAEDPPTRWHRLLDVHAFPDRSAGLGRVAMALGNAYLATRTPSKNGSALFHLVMSPHDTLAHSRYSGLSRRGLEAVLAAISNCREVLGRGHRGSDDVVARAELGWIADALELGARIGLARLDTGSDSPLFDLPSEIRDDLARKARTLAESLRSVWLTRHRTGGLEESIARLDCLRKILV